MIHTFKRVTLAAAVGLFVAGCTTVGSDFTAPKNVAGIDTSTGFRHAVPGQSDTAAHLPKEWWTVFNDATLDRLERSALQDNPSVRAAAQRLLQARAQLGLVQANQSPSLNVGASFENDRSSANTAEGQALGPRSRTTAARPIPPRARHWAASRSRGICTRSAPRCRMNSTCWAA